MTSDLAGRTALVTGASSGIGAAVAVHLADAGARVILVARDAGRLAETQARLAGGGHRSISIDLTDAAAVADLGRTLAADGTSIDAVVHCAGVYGPTPFLQVGVEQLDHTWSVNVRAPFLLAQAVVKLMPSGSSMVFVSSVSGHVGMALQSVYGTTKSAVDGLARVLAVELAPLGIRVNALAPGFTATAMNAHLRADPSRVERIEASTLLGRLGQVDEIARAARFLVSDDSSFIDGITLQVDGGYPVSHIQTGRPL